MSRKTARNLSRKKGLRPLAGLMAMGLTAPVMAGKSVPFPTYETGPQANGSYVVSSGQIINPAGIQVDLGIRVRAKAIAVNPNRKSHSAAVLTMGASQAVEVFDTLTGEIKQIYLPLGQDPSGSYGGITYSADGKYLMFSQDSSYVAISNVLPDGTLTDYAHVSVPPNTSFIACFPNSPIGDYQEPCGTLYTPSTSYPGGVAFAEDGKSAYALLNQNNTLTKIDLAATPLAQGTQIRVGNAPHSIVIKGRTAYISNEGGRAATDSDFQVLSAGTPIVADAVNGSAITGTVSVVDLPTMQVVETISDGIGLHPTGMALFGDALLVSNTYSDTISVIDTATNKVMRTIDLGLPIKVPGRSQSAYGAAPNSIAVDERAGVAYIALYNANAVAVVDLSGSTDQPVLGMIPVAYAPASVVLDEAQHELIVANDKGIGARLSFETDYRVTDYNTHQDNGTVSIVPLNFPQFDLNVPDQFRVDLWVQDFKKDVASGSVPSLSILWIMDDHTGGPPTAPAEQADNDLAVGRIIDYISHSSVWKSSAIFIEEDDAQNGVDRVDGHRSPGYVVSPYAVQNGPTDHTYYTQVNMTRTIEQILGLPPMNQFDLVASPMRTAFVKEKAQANLEPFTHLPNQIPLDQGVTTAMTTSKGAPSALAKAWGKAKAKIFAGKSTKPDSEDPDTVNHLAWYEATGFKRPYPGETTVRPPSEFVNRLGNPHPEVDD